MNTPSTNSQNLKSPNLASNERHTPKCHKIPHLPSTKQEKTRQQTNTYLPPPNKELDY
jgi:hypothetical protein